MSTKGRIKFATRGLHPLLYILQDHLISKGYALITDGSEVDFYLVGGLGDWKLDSPAPVLLLSDGSMYSDRDFSFKIRDKKPMKEDDPIFIPSPLEPSVAGTLQYLMNENKVFTMKQHAMVLRIFSVYGPTIRWGDIHDILYQTNQGYPLKMVGNGYHTRTFLHESDLIEIFDRLLKAFLSGTSGIYNVGSTDEISTKRLLESVYQLKYGADAKPPIEVVPGSRAYRWWVLPDMTRTQAIVKYKPRVSLRTGIWQLINGS